MLLQALGSVRLCWEGMLVAVPEVHASFSALPKTLLPVAVWWFLPA
jgi:hypothetical protein